MHAAVSYVSPNTRPASSKTIDAGDASKHGCAQRDQSKGADFSSAFRGLTFGVSVCVPVWSMIGLAIYWLAGGGLF